VQNHEQKAAHQMYQDQRDLRAGGRVEGERDGVGLRENSKAVDDNVAEEGRRRLLVAHEGGLAIGQQHAHDERGEYDVGDEVGQVG